MWAVLGYYITVEEFRRMPHEVQGWDTDPAWITVGTWLAKVKTRLQLEQVLASQSENAA